MLLLLLLIASFLRAGDTFDGTPNLRQFLFQCFVSRADTIEIGETLGEQHCPQPWRCFHCLEPTIATAGLRAVDPQGNELADSGINIADVNPYQPPGNFKPMLMRRLGIFPWELRMQVRMLIRTSKGYYRLGLNKPVFVLKAEDFRCNAHRCSLLRCDLEAAPAHAGAVLGKVPPSSDADLQTNAGQQIDDIAAGKLICIPRQRRRGVPFIKERP